MSARFADVTRATPQTARELTLPLTPFATAPLPPPRFPAAPGRRRPARGLLTAALCALAAASVALATGCEENEVVTPTRYLERPNAVDFFCVGPVVDEANQDYTALPPYACDEEIEGADRRAIFGLVTNSARSEVAMVNVSTGQLVDLTNENPGFGFVPVGEMPVDVDVTEDGCAGYVTNYGSCDLSVVNFNAVLQSSGLPILDEGRHGAPTGRIGIRSASGRLLARIHDLALKPEWIEQLPPVQACGPVEGHRAYVSLPSCGLVAEVDLDSGRILQSLRFGEGGAVQSAGIDPQCPADCVDFSGDGVAGGAVSEQRPGPLRVTWDGRRLVIGWNTAPYVTLVDIDPVTGAFANPRTLTLAEEQRGVLRIRETVTWTHDWHFLYVISRSGVVHVIDADREQECETNPDPTDPFFPEDPADDAAWEVWSERRGCLPLGDPSTPERAPGVKTPALQLPGGRQAVDVQFIELFADGYEDSNLTTLDPRYLVGNFAYVVSADGLAYLVNVDEDFSETLDPDVSVPPVQHRRADGVHAVLAHQLRSALDTRPDEDGRPRPPEDEPQRLYFEAEALPDDGGYDRIRKVSGGPEPDIEVLDPRHVRTETWTLRYMGTLPTTDRDTGQVVRHDLADVAEGQTEFRDPGLPFCQAGVRDGDVVKLSGCDGDSDCAEGFYCYQTFLQPAGTTGICLAEDAGTDLEGRCEGLTLSLREYTVVRAESERLVLEPRELTDATRITECADEDLAGYCCDEQGEGLVVGLRRDDRCFAAPEPDLPHYILFSDGTSRTAHCTEGLRRYTIRVGEDQYLLSGSRSGAPVMGVPDAVDGGHCIHDPSRSTVITARVPRREQRFRNQMLAFTLELPAGATAEPPTFGYYLQFDLVAGFEPQGVDLSARLPAGVELAPDGYMYVVDQGDDSSLGGLQGQVLRLRPGDIALDTTFVVR